MLLDSNIIISRADLASGQIVRRDVTMPERSPISLKFEVFPRQLNGSTWLLTVVLRNTSCPNAAAIRELILYQTLFEVEIVDGEFAKYPESQRPFDQLDEDEKSLALLYREAASWAIAHGCAAGWDAEPNTRPEKLYADVMPAVQLPSMTPDIEIDGAPMKIAMRSLATLPDQPGGPAWAALDKVVDAYAGWIDTKRGEAAGLPRNLGSCRKPPS